MYFKCRETGMKTVCMFYVTNNMNKQATKIVYPTWCNVDYQLFTVVEEVFNPKSYTCIQVEILQYMYIL